ncbi:oxygenase MpaB family protein, partial [Sphingomonas sp.]|uniref:oxygenase MpaB family protein n=1 Tax=Sphingomonas sp. TaxID=28214 RepID=UPI003B3BB27D
MRERSGVMPGPRHAIEAQIHRLVGFGTGDVDLDSGDAGLFGPESAAWTVHADFTAMMIGGIAALLLQMLHPAALAAVWDHFDFRGDMRLRLRRTAQFVAGTTYGSTMEAERLIARVRMVHARVRGTMPDGTPYSADDPGLLAWVHAAEVSSFLAAHVRYCDPHFPEEAQDRYLREVAVIAQRLGAIHVPQSRAALDRYWADIRPELRADDRTRVMARALLGQRAPKRVMAPLGRVMMEAGIDLLPDWARAMHGFGPRPQALLRVGVAGAGGVLRWALRDGSAA